MRLQLSIFFSTEKLVLSVNPGFLFRSGFFTQLFRKIGYFVLQIKLLDKIWNGKPRWQCRTGNRLVLVPQIIAAIFNTEVYTLEETANSASLGCAYRAKHGIHNKSVASSYLLVEHQLRQNSSTVEPL